MNSDLNQLNKPATIVHEDGGISIVTSLEAKRNLAGPNLQLLPFIWQRLVAAKSLIISVVITTVFLIHTFHLNVVAEDAYITFRFARHLANGQGFIWNVGEAPVEGYTNFLWLLLSSLLIKGGLSITLFTQLFGVLASLVTLFYTYQFGRKILNLPSDIALIPCLFLAVSGPFAAWASSGMETNLFGLFLLAGCYYFASWVKFDSINDLILGYLMMLLGTLTRPEGVIVFALVTLLGMMFLLHRSRVVWVRYTLALSVYVIPFLIYFFWRYSYFGYLLPNTFYAKTGGGIYQYLRGVIYSGFFAFHFLMPLLPLLFIFIWEHGFNGVIGKEKWQSITRHLKEHLGIYLCVMVSIVFTLYIVYVGGDYMAMYRFFVPILPFLYLLTGPVMHSVYKNVAGISHKGALVNGVIAFTIGLTFLQSTPLEGKLFRKPEFMHGTYQGIQIERWHVARYKVIADFFSEYKRSAQDSLALGPIGLISYYSGMTIYSFYGIVDPYIAHKPMTGLDQVLAGHEKYDLSYVLAKKPTYVMYSLSLGSDPEPFPSYSEEVNKVFREDYQLKSVWLEDRANGEAGYFTFLERK